MEWNDLRFLLAVARAGSLTSAARTLGVATTTAGRRVAALEGAVGLKLVRRHPDGVALTPAGLRLVELAAGIAAQVRDVEKDLGAPGENLGEIRVSATESIGTEIVSPSLPRLYSAHPTLRVTLRSESGLADFARGGADIAIRMNQPKRADLVRRRLGVFRLGVYAAASMDSHEACAALTYDESYGSIPERDWLHQRGYGAARLQASSTRVLVEATRAGLGVAVLPTFWAERVEGLKRVDLKSPPDRTAWLVYHADSRDLPSIRVVADHLIEVFRQALEERG